MLTLLRKRYHRDPNTLGPSGGRSSTEHQYPCWVRWPKRYRKRNDGDGCPDLSLLLGDHRRGKQASWSATAQNVLTSAGIVTAGMIVGLDGDGGLMGNARRPVVVDHLGDAPRAQWLWLSTSWWRRWTNRARPGLMRVYVSGGRVLSLGGVGPALGAYLQTSVHNIGSGHRPQGWFLAGRARGP